MACHVEVKNAPSIMPNNEEDIKHAEANGRHCEEVHGRDGFAMIAKKRQPALAGICSSWGKPHPAGDATLRDVEPQHHEFSVNPGSTPSGVLGHHFKDELPDLLAHGPPTDPLAHAGNQPPIHLKARTVPAHHGIRRHYH